MKKFLNRALLGCVALIVVALLTTRSEAQNTDSIKVGSTESFDDQLTPTKTLDPAAIKTLDELRRLRTIEYEKSKSESFVVPPSASGLEVGMLNENEREALKDSILALQQEISKPGVDRKNVEGSLRLALTEYFVRDMQKRVQELDVIKAKVAETEAKLQKRLDSQKESIELQLQIMVREADGLGYFPTANVGTNRSATSFSPVNSGLPSARAPGIVVEEENLFGTGNNANDPNGVSPFYNPKPEPR